MTEEETFPVVSKEAYRFNSRNAIRWHAERHSVHIRRYHRLHHLRGRCPVRVFDDILVPRSET